VSALFSDPENTPAPAAAVRSCPTCGREVHAAPAGSRGRPRLYCSEGCQRIESLRSTLEREVSALVEELRADGRQPSDEVWRLRGALRRIANLLNAVGRLTRIAGPARMTRSGGRGLRR
jgi:endogenous inhibitor of DNA gyrase (YacG/DUF329 family)